MFCQKVDFQLFKCECPWNRKMRLRWRWFRKRVTFWSERTRGDENRLSGGEIRCTKVVFSTHQVCCPLKLKFAIPKTWARHGSGIRYTCCLFVAVRLSWGKSVVEENVCVNLSFRDVFVDVSAKMEIRISGHGCTESGYPVMKTDLIWSKLVQFVKSNGSCRLFMFWVRASALIGIWDIEHESSGSGGCCYHNALDLFEIGTGFEFRAKKWTFHFPDGDVTFSRHLEFEARWMRKRYTLWSKRTSVDRNVLRNMNVMEENRFWNFQVRVSVKSKVAIPVMWVSKAAHILIGTSARWRKSANRGEYLCRKVDFHVWGGMSIKSEISNSEHGNKVERWSWSSMRAWVYEKRSMRLQFVEICRICIICRGCYRLKSISGTLDINVLEAVYFLMERRLCWWMPIQRMKFPEKCRVFTFWVRVSELL